MCAGGRLDAGMGEITFTTELDAPPRLTAFPYVDLLRLYLLFSPAGDISIVVNARRNSDIRRLRVERCGTTFPGSREFSRSRH